MKRRWKQTAGFTLVELIVVIAILGILTAIAVPTYSGYVKKANMAADQTLVETINTAFAAACIENQVDLSAVESNEAKIVIGDEGAWTPEMEVDGIDLVEDFLAYMGGNTAINPFKVVTDLQFDSVKDMFIIKELKAYGYGGGNLYISDADAQKLGLSTFITNGQLGVDGLMAKVNDVTIYAALMAGSNAMYGVLSSEGFLDAAAAALDVNKGDLDSMATELAEKMVAKNPGVSIEDAKAQVYANAAVLYAAQNTPKMSTSDITALLNEDGAKDKIVANLNGTDAQKGLALSQAAVAYGLYTSYAYSTGNQTLIDDTEDPLKILNGLNDEGFQTYINSEQGQIDMEGYMSAMNMINGSTKDSSAVKELMVNGFTDPNLANVLKESLGQ